MLHRRRRHRRPSSRLRYLLAAPLVALSLGSGLAPAVTAQAAVACVPDFSNVAGVNLDETTSCGSTTTEVAANVGGFATLSPNDQFVARWDNTYHGHAYVQAVDGSGTVDLGEGISPAWAPDNSRVALTTRLGVRTGQRSRPCTTTPRRSGTRCMPRMPRAGTGAC
jgi:hypothetical protein